MALAQVGSIRISSSLHVPEAAGRRPVLSTYGPSPAGTPVTESRVDREDPVDIPVGGSAADVRGDYRYTLTRTWDSSAEPLVFILLNPSTADASQDDPTIRRCIGFAKRWAFGGIVVVNLYAYRATKPRDMFAADDPVGPDNDRIIAQVVEGKTVVAAWGANARRERFGEVLELIPGTARLLALQITKKGHPRHPLYVLGEAQPVPWPASPSSSPRAAHRAVGARRRGDSAPT